MCPGTIKEGISGTLRFRRGDFVTLLPLPRFEFGRGVISNDSIGVVVQAKRGTKGVVLVDFPEQRWKGRKYEIKLLTSGFYKGDLVQINPQRDHVFQYGRGNVHPSSVGVLRGIDDDSFQVDFAEHHMWRGTWGDIFPMQRKWKPGEMIRKNPLRDGGPDWGIVGVITAVHTDGTISAKPGRDKAGKEWRGDRQCLIPAACTGVVLNQMTRFSIGQKVRSERGLGVISSARRDGSFQVEGPRGSSYTARSHVLKPARQVFLPGAEVVHNQYAYSSGLTAKAPESGCVGIVKVIHRTLIHVVEFPDGLWEGMETELLPPDFTFVPGAFAAGDKVQLQESAAFTKGRGGVRLDSVGVITEVTFRGKVQTVHVQFPENPSWVGLASEVTRSFHEFRPGDTVIANTFKSGKNGLEGVGSVVSIAADGQVWVRWIGGETPFLEPDLMKI